MCSMPFNFLKSLAYWGKIYIKFTNFKFVKVLWVLISVHSTINTVTIKDLDYFIIPQIVLMLFYSQPLYSQALAPSDLFSVS